MRNEVEKALGYAFKDKGLLKRALTLSSASENENNQSLEFFGDAVLEYIVSEELFKEGGSEGELTERRKAIVSDSALTPVSEKLNLDKFLIRGKSDTNNKKAIPSAYEAITAAIYLDGGMKAAKKFVLSTLDFSGGAAPKNYKGELQELLQARGEELPSYLREDAGTPQKPLFKVRVSVFGQTFEGLASSAKTAEQLAAKNAIEYSKNQ